MRGLDFALNDICLAAFTTLAPGATLAYVVLACTLLFGKLDSRLRQRIESWLIVPLAVATVGLVASATHLGTPSNALYVFRTVGSSPLATEVFSAVLFLGTSCSYWLGCIYIEGIRHCAACGFLPASPQPSSSLSARTSPTQCPRSSHGTRSSLKPSYPARHSPA